MDEPAPELTAEDEEEYMQEESTAQLYADDDDDGGGGGFIVDDPAAADGAKSSAVSQIPHCVECESKSLSRQHQEVFGVNVCKECCNEHSGKYGVCTKTTAKTDYLLTDEDFKPLQFIKKKNPHKEAWGAMHLYLRCQLEAVAVLKYPGLHGIEVERERKRLAAAERSKGGKKTKGSVLRKGEEKNPDAASADTGAKGIFQSKRQKTSASDKAAAPYVGRHVHKWEGEWNEDGSGGSAVWKKKCSECGLVQKFEKL